MLAILDANDIAHPSLECVFTSDEEVGMGGVEALDVHDIMAKRLLSLDLASENTLVVSCAASARVECSFSGVRSSADGTVLRIDINGLKGGHSGEEIHLGRANANKLMGKLLYACAFMCSVRIISLNGGEKTNAIPTSATAYIVVDKADLIKAVIDNAQREVCSAYADTDAQIKIVCSESKVDTLPLDEDTSRRIIAFLNTVPNGVFSMSEDVEGLVVASSNLGIVRDTDNGVECIFMPRSNINSQMDEIVNSVKGMCESFDGDFKLSSVSSAWEYKKESPLRDTMCNIMTKVYGKEPRVMAIHAGIECGVFSQKIPGLDCVSIGPDMDNIHTPRERLHIASTNRTWKALLEALKQL